MGRGERLFSFFDEFFSLLISNDNRVGVLSGDSVDELAHLFKRGGSALQCGFHRIIYIRSIHFNKIKKYHLILRHKFCRKNLLELLMQISGFCGRKVWIFVPFLWIFFTK